MIYNLKLEPAQAQLVWQALMELPAKVSYTTLKSVEEQYKACETPLPVVPPPEPPPEST